MNKFFALVLVMLLIYTNAFALGGTSNSQGTSSIPSAGGSGSGTVTNIATGNGLTGGPITNTGTINLSTPDVTKIANYPLAAGDMAGQVNFNASSLTVTIPAISGTVFANGMTSLVTNYNSSALTISSTPTINGYSGTSIGQYGWVNFTSNGTSLDAFGFPGFGTITSNALSKFSGTSGIQTASSVIDDGTTITLGAGGATVTEASGNANFGAITVSSCTGCGAVGTVTLGTSAAATSPQRSGAVTTGLFSASVGTVSVSSGGTDVSDFTSTGQTVTAANTKALAVGANGGTNPVFAVDSSTASVASGIAVKGAATGGITTITETDSGSNSGLELDSKGTGALILQGAGRHVFINSTTQSFPSGITDTVVFLKDPGGLGTPLFITGGATFGEGFAIQSTAPGGLTWQITSTVTADGDGGGHLCINQLNAGAPPDAACWDITGRQIGLSTGTYGFGSTNSQPSSNDIAISRVSSGVLGVGNGTSGDVSGKLDAAGINIGTTTALTGATLNVIGHIGTTQATAPVASTCGGGTVSANSTDNKWTVTGITAATACTITFNTALPAAPVCIFNTNTGIAVGGIASTTAVTTTMVALTGTLQGICF